MKTQVKARRPLTTPSYRLVQLLLLRLNVPYSKLEEMTGIPRATLCRVAIGTVENVNEEYYRILYNLCLEYDLV